MCREKYALRTGTYAEFKSDISGINKDMADIRTYRYAGKMQEWYDKNSGDYGIVKADFEKIWRRQAENSRAFANEQKEDSDEAKLKRDTLYRLEMSLKGNTRFFSNSDEYNRVILVLQKYNAWLGEITPVGKLTDAEADAGRFVHRLPDEIADMRGIIRSDMDTEEGAFKVRMATRKMEEELKAACMAYINAKTKNGTTKPYTQKGRDRLALVQSVLNETANGYEVRKEQAEAEQPQQLKQPQQPQTGQQVSQQQSPVFTDEQIIRRETEGLKNYSTGSRYKELEKYDREERGKNEGKYNSRAAIHSIILNEKMSRRLDYRQKKQKQAKERIDEINAALEKLQLNKQDRENERMREENERIPHVPYIDGMEKEWKEKGISDKCRSLLREVYLDESRPLWQKSDGQIRNERIKPFPFTLKETEYIILNEDADYDTFKQKRLQFNRYDRERYYPELSREEFDMSAEYIRKGMDSSTLGGIIAEGRNLNRQAQLRMGTCPDRYLQEEYNIYNASLEQLTNSGEDEKETLRLKWLTKKNDDINNQSAEKYFEQRKSELAKEDEENARLAAKRLELKKKEELELKKLEESEQLEKDRLESEKKELEEFIATDYTALDAEFKKAQQVIMGDAFTEKEQQALLETARKEEEEYAREKVIAPQNPYEAYEYDKESDEWKIYNLPDMSEEERASGRRALIIWRKNWESRLEIERQRQKRREEFDRNYDEKEQRKNEAAEWAREFELERQQKAKRLEEQEEQLKKDEEKEKRQSEQLRREEERTAKDELKEDKQPEAELCDIMWKAHESDEYRKALNDDREKKREYTRQPGIRQNSGTG